MGQVTWPITSKEETTTQNSCWNECHSAFHPDGDTGDGHGDNEDTCDSNGNGDNGDIGDIYDGGRLVEKCEVGCASPDQPFLCMENQHLFETKNKFVRKFIFFLPLKKERGPCEI